MSAYVYAMVREDGAIKIGHTMYLKERLATVGALAFVGIEKHPDSIESRNREKQLHAQLDQWRLDGEWFSPSDEVLSVAKGLGSPVLETKTVMFSSRVPRDLYRKLKCFAAETEDTVSAVLVRFIEEGLKDYEVKL